MGVSLLSSFLDGMVRDELGGTRTKPPPTSAGAPADDPSPLLFSGFKGKAKRAPARASTGLHTTTSSSSTPTTTSKTQSRYLTGRLRPDNKPPEHSHSPAAAEGARPGQASFTIPCSGAEGAPAAEIHTSKDPGVGGGTPLGSSRATWCPEADAHASGGRHIKKARSVKSLAGAAGCGPDLPLPRRGNRTRALSKRYADIEKTLRQDVSKLEGSSSNPARNEPDTLLRCYRMAFDAFLECCAGTAAPFAPLLQSIKNGYETLINEGFESKVAPLRLFVAEQRSKIAALEEELAVEKARVTHNKLEIHNLKHAQISGISLGGNTFGDELAARQEQQQQQASRRQGSRKVSFSSGVGDPSPSQPEEEEEEFDVDVTCPDAVSGITLTIVDDDETAVAKSTSGNHSPCSAGSGDASSSSSRNPLSWLAVPIDTSICLENT